MNLKYFVNMFIFIFRYISNDVIFWELFESNLYRYVLEHGIEYILIIFYPCIFIGDT